MSKIEELEKKWMMYKIKKLLKLYFFPAILLTIGFIGYYYLFFAINKKEKPNITESQVSASFQHESKKSETQSSLNIASSKEILAQKSDSISQSSISIQESSISSESKIAQSLEITQKQQEPQIEQIKIIKDCYFVNTPILNIREKPSTESMIVGKLRLGETVCPIEIVGEWSKIDRGWVFNKNLIRLSQEENTPIEAEKKSQTQEQVIIDYKDLNISKKIELLKDRFQTSKDVKIAIEIAEIYYENKDYTQAQNWALLANDLDKDSEASWILFAKSAYKLGNKDAAIKALMAYLRRVDSSAVRSLLADIQKDAL